MSSRPSQYPGHLRPVPDSGGSAAPANDRPRPGHAGADPAAAPRPLARLHHRRPGRARLRRRGGRSQAAIEAARTRRPHARVAAARAGRDQRRAALAGDRRALRARPRRPRRLPGRRRRGGTLPGDDGAPLQGGPGRLRRSADAAGRRPPTPPTSSPSTTSRSRPASTAGSRSPPRRTSRRCSAGSGRCRAPPPRRSSRSTTRRKARGERPVADMQVSAEDAPVIKLVYSVLAQAVGEGASDIHLEPEEGEMRVRFRVDGVLKETAHVPRRMIGAVISRLKIMSELDIAEKRVPQDGRVGVSRRGPPRRPARDHPADSARRGGDDPHPRRRQRSAHARRTRHGRRGADRFEHASTRPTARCSSPGRPARARRRRSTRRSPS